MNLLMRSFEYRFVLINAAVFLVLSLGCMILKPANVAVVLFPNAIFLLGGLIGWLLMMGRGWALAPISWYVLGTGLFFGFGVFAGGLHVNPWSEKMYGEDSGYLIQVNILNAASVFIVLATAGFFFKSFVYGNDEREKALDNSVREIVPISYFLFFCFLVSLLKMVLFPDVESLLIRSILAKLYFLFPAVFVLGGIVFHQMRWVDRLLFVLVLMLQLLNGVLLGNKYEILMPIVAMMAGMLVSKKSHKYILALLAIPVVVFWVSNPVVSLTRLHYKYDPIDNNLLDRVEIVKDVLVSTHSPSENALNPKGAVRDSLDVSARMSLIERVKSVGIRFDVASIEGFLIREYDENRPGNSLKDFFTVFVPRVFWPDKPVVTRFGNELNFKYHGNDPAHSYSAIAPTYSGEAYWNYGWAGVLAVSIYLGICFGLFSRIALNASTGADVAYLFVAYPLLISAAFVESWISATYIGGMAIIVFYYAGIKLLFSLIARGQKSA